MEHKNTQKKLSKNRFGRALVILFILVLLGTGYFRYQIYATEAYHAKLNTSIQNTQKTIQSLQTSDDRPDHFISASILKQKEKERILWSEIIPTLLEFESNVMTFHNFNIDSKKNISVNGSTRSMQNIPSLITKIKDHPTLQNPFVASVASSTDSDSTLPVSFSLTLQSR